VFIPFLSRTRATGSTRLATAQADEVGVRMVANGFARSCFLLRGIIGHAFIDAIENLLFGEAGIFEPADLSAAESRQLLEFALKDEIDGGVGKANEPEHDGIAADGIDLIESGKIENFGFGVARGLEVADGVGAVERVTMSVRGGDELNGSIVADVGGFELQDLGDFIVVDVQFFELLNSAGKNACLHERTIVRQRMGVASDQRNH
jgi:hypothetical protein